MPQVHNSADTKSSSVEKRMGGQKRGKGVAFSASGRRSVVGASDRPALVAQHVVSTAWLVDESPPQSLPSRMRGSGAGRSRSSNACCGGARAGAFFGISVGNPRCERIRRMTLGSSMQATKRSLPPHFAHAPISSVNTRESSTEYGYRLCGGSFKSASDAASVPAASPSAWVTRAGFACGNRARS